MNELKKFFKEYSVSPEELNGVLASVNSAELKQKLKLEKVLARPNVDIALLEKGVLPLHEMRQQFDNEIFESAEIEMKYESYIPVSYTHLYPAGPDDHRTLALVDGAESSIHQCH